MKKIVILLIASFLLLGTETFALMPSNGDGGSITSEDNTVWLAFGMFYGVAFAITALILLMQRMFRKTKTRNILRITTTSLTFLFLLLGNKTFAFGSPGLGETSPNSLLILIIGLAAVVIIIVLVALLLSYLGEKAERKRKEKKIELLMNVISSQAIKLKKLEARSENYNEETMKQAKEELLRDYEAEGVDKDSKIYMGRTSFTVSRWITEIKNETPDGINHIKMHICSKRMLEELENEDE